MVNHLNQFSHHLTTGISANVFQQVQAKSLLPFGNDPPCWLERPAGCELWEPADLITTKNAIIHLPTLAMAMEKPDANLVFSIPATPRYFSPCALPFEFDINAPDPKHWLEFLLQVWEEDPEAIETLQEFFGLCLVPDTSLQKILLLLGPKRSGKGTIARVLRAIVGEDNCCGPTMGSLGMNFGLQSLLNKSVAIISDARLSGRTDSAVVTERLLSISGEDALTVDIKYREPIDVKLRTRIVIMTNELPRLGDSSGALAGRLIILRMTETFYGREDHRLTTKLMEERAGILLWAVVGLTRLRDRGYLIQPASGKGLREHMEDIASPVGQFVRERCELGASFDEPTKSLYAAYQAWTLSKGGKPTIDSIFARDLFAAFSAVRSVRKREGEFRYSAYQGIRLQRDWVEGA